MRERRRWHLFRYNKITFLKCRITQERISKDRVKKECKRSRREYINRRWKKRRRRRWSIDLRSRIFHLYDFYWIRLKMISISTKTELLLKWSPKIRKVRVKAILRRCGHSSRIDIDPIKGEILGWRIAIIRRCRCSQQSSNDIVLRIEQPPINAV